MIKKVAAYKPADPDRIVFTDKAGLQYWTAELECSRDALISAIEEVGNHVVDVRNYLVLKPI